MHESPNEAIRSTLLRWAGDAPDSSAIAEAALMTWSRVSGRLEPVIGMRGVDALFDRAMHLTCKTYPWLAASATEDDEVAPGVTPVVPALTNLMILRLRLADREPELAEEAGYILLVTFTALLANLIGESLTQRLLAPVWSPPRANPEEMSPP